ncbi:GTPase [Nostocoides sp. Soil756]|jgi:GTP-binding protein EngB required for normal cell division|uniref:GTPase n=1 Tax=Nostocoides sp. Soil756 TaxID=1736399 RepID=UPI0006F6277E|nr:GTPase [Tetrasphaera sp. Soil756]KRE62390.1 ABC transporter [Tetrasphaera sp. Soil756]
MSPLRMGRARGAVVSPERLAAAATSLDAAVEAGGEQLPARERRAARAVVEKVERRSALVGGHTVVALAGATGSGKSSLFNALVGADVATVGVRRPTTSTPTAAVWGDEPAGELLDWLGVGSRHHVTEEAGPQVGGLDGLVLLDLPDVDSREVAHRVEAVRVLELVDLFVWVADPQKYADARLHDDHVATLSSHEAVTMAVLNQCDRLAADDVDRLRTDLVRLMERDGMPGATVLMTSVRTGAGIDELRQRLANVVASRTMARARLAADVRSAAGALSGHVGTSEGGVDAAARSELLDALARSAGLPAVVEAVARDYRMEAAADTGWPFTRWVHRLRARPLRRLRLDGRDVRVTESDVRSVLGRSSLPPPSPAARAAVALATRRVADRAAADLPTPWAEALHRAATPPGPDLGDALDQAVVGTSLYARSPLWWRAVGLVQLVLAAAAVVGLAWLAAYAVAGWLQLDQLVPDAPTVGVLPAPFLLLAGGLLLGPLLAALAAWLARIGARRRAAVMERRLRSSIETVADAKIVAPVRRVLERHAATREALRHAADV